MGWRAGREEEKPSQMKTRGDKLPTDGSDHATKRTSFWSRVEFQADNTQLVHSTGANVSVMVYRAVNPPLRKALLESSHKRHGVWIAIEYSYKLGQKMN